jgi:hypothetical protein
MGANAFETGFCRNCGTTGFGWTSWNLNCWKMTPWKNFGWRSWTLSCWRMKPWRSFDLRNLTWSDWESKRGRSFGWKAWRPKGTDGCSWGRCEPVTRTGTKRAAKAPRPGRSRGRKAWRPKGTDGWCWGRCEPVTRTGATKAAKAPRPARNFWAQSVEMAAPMAPTGPKGKIPTPIQPGAESNFRRAPHPGPCLGWRRGG